MALHSGAVLSRRNFVGGLGALGAAGLVAAPAIAAPVAASQGLRPELLRRALAALDKHKARIAHRDVIAVADFAVPSSQKRFHFVDMVNGRTTSLLVSHGRGSDPAHSGWVSRLSNEIGSLASSQGAYLTSDLYVGKHGRSRRLIGLDPTNSNAMPRAVVVHAAWYVSPEMVRDHGKLGRSEGCFAVSEAELEQVLARLGTGRMIYADKA